MNSPVSVSRSKKKGHRCPQSSCGDPERSLFPGKGVLSHHIPLPGRILPFLTQLVIFAAFLQFCKIEIQLSENNSAALTLLCSKPKSMAAKGSVIYARLGYVPATDSLSSIKPKAASIMPASNAA